MKKEKIFLLGIFLTLTLMLPRSARAAAPYSVGVSTTAQKLVSDLTDISKDAQAAPAFFDSSAFQRGQAQPVFAQARANKASSSQAAAPVLQASSKRAVAAAVPSPAKGQPTTTVTKTYAAEGSVEVTASGNAYRYGTYKEVSTTVVPLSRPWWKVWAPTSQTTVVTTETPALEKAAPDENGNVFDEQGKFVGKWQTIQSVKLQHGFQAVKEADGQDHIYTQEDKPGARQVLRDGKPAFLLETTAQGGSLTAYRPGADGKYYAMYRTGQEDVIVSVDRAGKQTVAARVKSQIDVTKVNVAEVAHYEDYGHYRTVPGRPGYYERIPGDPGYYERIPGNPGYYEYVPGRSGYYDSGNRWHEGTSGYQVWHAGTPDTNVWHPGTPDTNVWIPGTPDVNVWVVDGQKRVVDVPAHVVDRVDRSSVDQFRVGEDGAIYTLFRGNVIAEGQAGGARTVLLDGKSYASDAKIPLNSTTEFARDSKGTIYTRESNGRLSVDGRPVDLASLGIKNVANLRIDDNGNLYTTDGGLRKHLINPTQVKVAQN